VPRLRIWSCTPTPPYIFMAWCLIKSVDNFTVAEHYLYGKILLPFLRELQSMTNLGLLYDCSPLIPILWLSSPFRWLRLAAIVESFSTIKALYRVGLWTLRRTPNLENQGIPFCLDLPLACPAWEILEKLRYRWHTSQNLVTTQAPPLRHTPGKVKSVLIHNG
jgi:hypothetical protein